MGGQAWRSTLPSVTGTTSRFIRNHPSDTCGPVRTHDYSRGTTMPGQPLRKRLTYLYMETTDVGRGRKASTDDMRDVVSSDIAATQRDIQMSGSSITGGSFTDAGSFVTDSGIKANRAANGRTKRKSNASGAAVEYGLSRNFLIDQFRKGRVSRRDICDAHPELLRAARNVGRGSSVVDCPVCEVSRVSYVTYAFGSGLPSGGRCVVDSREILKVKSRLRNGNLACYVIEVCPSCGWNHLVKTFWI